MSDQPQLFRIDPESRQSEVIAEVDFAVWDFKSGGIFRNGRPQTPVYWVKTLIVGKESGFDRTNERLDLLAVDSDGRLALRA